MTQMVGSGTLKVNKDIWDIRKKRGGTKSMARAAIITGASRGIGAVVAERLAKDGFTVVVNYAGSEAEASALVKRIKSAGGQAISVQADVSKVADVSHLFDAAEKQ